MDVVQIIAVGFIAVIIIVVLKEFIMVAGASFLYGKECMYQL